MKKNDIVAIMRNHVNLEKKLTQSKFEVSRNLKDTVGMEVRLSEGCVNWYREEGEQCGIPFDELTEILKRPKVTILNARMDFHDILFDVRTPEGRKFVVSHDNLSWRK